MIAAAKMNKVNPEAWLAWILEHTQDPPANRNSELLSWKCQDMIDSEEAEAEAQNND